ncbi:MAG: hypothetical protein LBK40_08105 [Spirochaetaceae bacterium]|jgi:hypothetical protein|nr:hypothetical protein [Spirochaetaceae bacterium]
MVIEQTIEIPESGILHLDIALPSPYPTGAARLELAITPAVEGRPQSLDKTLEKIWTLCEGSRLSVDRFLEMRREDNELEEAKYRRLFRKTKGES